MTKHILLSSTALFAAACSTQPGEFNDYELDDVNAEAKNIEYELPEIFEEDMEAILEGLAGALQADKQQSSIVHRVYAPPAPDGANVDTPPWLCGANPDQAELIVLDSTCRGMNLRWGWEINVDECVIDGETYTGSMLITYDELRSVPAFMPVEMVIDTALEALQNNLQGNASLRYDLLLEGDGGMISGCGQEQGPASFRFVDREMERISATEDTVEFSRTQEMRHELQSDGPGTPAQNLSNSDGDYEISLEDGDRAHVSFRAVGAVVNQGEQWPRTGVVYAHVERVGDVQLHFTEETPLDGTVEIVTPFGVVTSNLPVE